MRARSYPNITRSWNSTKDKLGEQTQKSFYKKIDNPRVIAKFYCVFGLDLFSVHVSNEKKVMDHPLNQ
jgi:hypothetical protein